MNVTSLKSVNTTEENGLVTPIVPAETSLPAVKAEMSFVNVTFGLGGQYAIGCINLYDINDVLLQSSTVDYTEEELADWGTDDEYVLTLGLQKLGYQPI